MGILYQLTEVHMFRGCLNPCIPNAHLSWSNTKRRLNECSYMYYIPLLLHTGLKDNS